VLPPVLRGNRIEARPWLLLKGCAIALNIPRTPKFQKWWKCPCDNAIIINLSEQTVNYIDA
jgi:hypothetical protein